MSEQQETQAWTNERINELIDKYYVMHHTPRGLVRRVAYEIRDDYQQRLDAVTQERDKLRAEIKQLNTALDTASRAVSELECEVEQLQEERNDLRTELHAYQAAHNRTLPPGYTRQRRKGGEA